MEAVNGIGASGLGASLTSATQSSLGKEDFLKLLVAQLAHQDPLSPMENQEFVAQLAQFSSLEQMTNVNSNLQLLQVAQASMTNSQIASLIGKNVEVRSDQVRLLGGVRHGETQGGPVAIEVGNTEWPKWEQVMSADPVDPVEL